MLRYLTDFTSDIGLNDLDIEDEEITLNGPGNNIRLYLMYDNPGGAARLEIDHFTIDHCEWFSISCRNSTGVEP